MRVIVIGSGLAGLTTAHYLVADGHEVIVIDRQPGPGLETSRANGSMLTPSMADPWNAPGVLQKLLRWIGREDAPLLLRARAIPGLVGWGARFLRNSAPERFRINMLRNLKLARYSVDLLRELRAETGIRYDEDTIGTVKVFRDAKALEMAERNADWLTAQGVPSRLLDVSETLALEPALAEVADKLVGAMHFPEDETGDARQFCEAIAGRLAAAGARLLYRTTLHAWERAGSSITALQTSAGTLEADAYVLAAGCYSVGLVAKLGIQLPIRPVKGYSITLYAAGWPQRPRIAVTDDTLHAAVVPVGRRLRIAGTAEFAGLDLSVRQARIDNLLKLLHEIYPAIHRRLGDEPIEPWAGLRPMSADGVPILGASPCRNLFLNTGHGHLGWTMATGSGRAVADIVNGRRPDIDPGDYALTRF